MRAPLGHVYRAVAPFAPEPPFRLYAGEGEPPVVVEETAKLTQAGGREFTVLVPVKARPVLVVAEPNGRFNEVVALRLRRYSRLSRAELTAVRSGEAEDLHPLDPECFPGLDEENAAIVTTSLRIPISALDMARPLGRIGENELRTIHELIVRAHEFDLGGLILRQAQELVDRLGSGDQ